jgi:hypothetical protein
LQLHHGADFLDIGAIDGQVQGLGQERIAGVLGFVLERDDAVLAGFGGKLDDLVDDGRQVKAFFGPGC